MSTATPGVSPAVDEKLSWFTQICYGFGDNQTAWIIVMSIWAVLALFLLLLCFKQCEEKVVIEARKKEDKLPVGKAIKCLLMNKYFLMAAFIWMMQCIIQMVTGTVLPYYCKYIFFDDSLFSYLLLLEVVTTIVTTVLFCPFLLRKFGKRNMSMLGCALALIGHWLMRRVHYVAYVNERLRCLRYC